MEPQPYSSLVQYTYTATADTQFRVMNTPLWMREANVHCVTNNAKYGNVTDQPATINANDIVIFQDFNLADIYFKNATAGSNTTIYVIGVTMSRGRMRDMGLL